MDLRAYTDQFIAAFKEDARAIGLEDVEEMPRATDEANLQAMADLVAALDRRGHTYRSDGSVYFKISTLPEYGRLARLDHEGIKPGARVDADSYAKEDARDFVLWKAGKPGEPSWDLVDPPGRPGWHLECSAMALRLLGEPPIDIHAGGIDLIFPHHENEIAQSEGATGRQFSRFWMHVEHLLVDDQKMSKSLGNTFTLSDAGRARLPAVGRAVPAALGALPEAAELHVGEPDADGGVAAPADRLPRPARHGDCVRARIEAVAVRVEAAKVEFADAMTADLNTAGALAAMFDLVRALNTAMDAGALGTGDVTLVKAAFDGFDRVLGILSLRRAEDAAPPVPVDEIERLIEERHAARRRRDFAEADRIRQDLLDRGIILEDSAAGTRWKRK